MGSTEEIKAGYKQKNIEYPALADIKDILSGGNIKKQVRAKLRLEDSFLAKYKDQTEFTDEELKDVAHIVYEDLKYHAAREVLGIDEKGIEELRASGKGKSRSHLDVLAYGVFHVSEDALLDNLRKVYKETQILGAEHVQAIVSKYLEHHDNDLQKKAILIISTDKTYRSDLETHINDLLDEVDFPNKEELKPHTYLSQDMLAKNWIKLIQKRYHSKAKKFPDIPTP